MSTRSIRYVPRSRQRGSMTVAVVFAVLVGLVLLGVAQLGYGYYMKREVQKAADLAALSAVQVLGTGAAADCSRAKAAGVSAALANLPNILDTFSAADVTVDCKLWDPTRPPVGGMPLFDPASGQLPNAMRVRIGKTLGNVIPSAFVGGDTVVSVQAVATSTQPVAAFTVGSRLLRLEKAVSRPRSWLGGRHAAAAGRARRGRPGHGQHHAVRLARCAGPAAVGGHRRGTPAQLAAVSNLTLGQLLNATLTVINKAGTAAADITLLNNAIKTVLQVMPLNLPVVVRRWRRAGSAGGGSVTSALQANVNALNILQTALVIANGRT